MHNSLLSRHRVKAFRATAFRSTPFHPWLISLKLLLAFCLVFLHAAMQANPVGPVVTQGAATFDAAGNRLTVTNTPGTVINWQTFNIPAGNTTHFQQQGADSSVLNRVVSNDPSKIFGTLSSNGRVILVNQSGIVVGAGAVVDTAGFIASTLNMSEADRLLNKGKFSGSGGSIQIDGMLRSSNGDIVLIAPQINVGTQALVKADNGTVMLAAGQHVMLTGRGLEGITLELQAPTDKVVNLGRLEGDAVGIFASQLRHSGAIVARNAVLEGGRVVLKAVDTATVEGSVDASGTGQASTGGRVTVEGNTVALQGATIAATGTKQGGQVLVGGGWQGKDAGLTNSQRTTVDGNSRINVSGQGTGSAGTAVVWSDGNTAFSGGVLAQGGQLGGNGGQVEVSGKEQLGFNGTAAVGAPKGVAGSILLDPKNIFITTSVGAPITGNVTFPDSGSITLFINNGTINGLLGSLAGGTLTLQATNDIDVNGALGAATNGTLNMEAGRTVNVSSAISLTGANSNLQITANSSNVTAASVTAGWRDPGAGGISQSAPITVGGNVYLNVSTGTGGGGNINAGNIAANNIFLDNQGPGNIFRNAVGNTLTGVQSVVLKAPNGIVGAPTARIAVDAPVFSVNAGGNAFLAVTGPGNATRLGQGASSVTGTFDILATGSALAIGAAGTETAPVSVTAGTITIAANTITVASTSVQSAIVGITTTGSLSLNGVNGVRIGSVTGAVSPVSLAANSLTVASSLGQVAIGGAPFVSSTATAAPTSINVANGASFTAGSIASNALVMQGGGGVGNTLSVNADSITLTANSMSAGIQLLGGTSNSAATIQATSGNITIDAGGSGLLVQGGNAGFSTVTVLATAGSVNVSTLMLGNVNITGGASPVAGGAVLQGQTGVGITATGALTIGNAGAGGSASVMAPAGTVTVQASAMSLAAGTGTGSNALVDAQNVVLSIATTGALTLDGSTASGNTASSIINSVGRTSATASDITLQANEGSAAIKSAGTVYLNSTANPVSVIGGSGLRSQAAIEGIGGVTASSPGGISVSGGSGASATASITSGPAGITLTVPSNNVSLTGGAGTASFASVSSTGPVTITGGGLNLTAGAGQDADAIVFASNGAALAIATGNSTVTTATLAGTSTAQLGVIVAQPLPSSDPAVSTFTAPSAVPGSGGQFTVTVSNLGANTDTLSLVTSLPGGTVTVPVGTLPPGSSTVVTVSYPISSTATGILVPVVTVSGLLSDTVATNNTTTGAINLTPLVNFGVSVGVTGLTLGVTNGVAVTVNNTGPSAGTGTVVITDPTGGSVSLVIGLLPGASSSTVIQFFVGAANVAYTVAASVVTVQPDSFTGNNSASQALLVPPEPPLPVTPSVTPTTTVTVPTPTPTLPTPTVTVPTPTPTLPTPTVTVPTPTPTLPTPTVTVPSPTPTLPPVVVPPIPPLPPVPPPVLPPVLPPTPPAPPVPNAVSNDPDPSRQVESFPAQFARLVALESGQNRLGEDDIVITNTQCRAK